MRLLIAGGGTGGHLFPGIAVAEAWRHRHPAAAIQFVGTRCGLEAHAVPQAGFSLAFLPVRGLRGKSPRHVLGTLGRLPQAQLEAWRLVRDFGPELALGVGGYASGPALLAAQAQRIPTVVMEQNAIAGWTNRILARLSTLVIAGMPVADLPANKTRVLGNPVREALLPVRAHPYRPQQPLRLLVLGGSQGARALNSAVIAALPLAEARGLRLEVVHQVGQGDLARVRAAYQHAHAEGLQMQPQVFAFIDDIARAYQHADLVLCRAGAMTLSEVTVCGLPSLLIPLPTAAGDHQTANARALAGVGAAVHLPQGELTGSALAGLLADFDEDRPRLMAMADRARSQGRPQALDDIVACLEACARHV